jgi:hypothetical protein
MFRHTVCFNCSILLLERLIPAMKDRLTYWDTATALYPLREEGNEGSTPALPGTSMPVGSHHLPEILHS